MSSDEANANVVRDPRIKWMNKFRGKFLPKGPLRERFRELQARWNSGDDHGGVTAEELESLYREWKAGQAAPSNPG